MQSGASNRSPGVPIGDHAEGEPEPKMGRSCQAGICVGSIPDLPTEEKGAGRTGSKGDKI